MPIYKVSVEKRMYSTGIVRVVAPSPREAEEAVDKMIFEGDISMSDIDWSDPAYEDTTFVTTGDID